MSELVATLKANVGKIVQGGGEKAVQRHRGKGDVKSLNYLFVSQLNSWAFELTF